MNGAELRDLVKFMVNADTNVPDAYLTDAVIDGAVQRAYEREWERAKTGANIEWCKGRYDGDIWAANTVFHTLPTVMVNKQVVDIYDMSANSEPGVRLVPNSDFTWTSRTEMQWNGTTGPGSDKPLRYIYEVLVEDIKDDLEPLLVPAQFHQLLTYSAAIQLRTILDEMVPSSWLAEYQELRLDYFKAMSRGRPLSMPPTIQGTDNDNTSQLVT